MPTRGIHSCRQTCGTCLWRHDILATETCGASPWRHTFAAKARYLFMAMQHASNKHAVLVHGDTHLQRTWWYLFMATNCSWRHTLAASKTVIVHGDKHVVLVHGDIHLQRTWWYLFMATNTQCLFMATYTCSEQDGNCSWRQTCDTCSW